MQPIYFDNNATTPLDPLVREAMQPYLQEIFGNPSSGHRFGEAARNAVEQARARVAALINAAPARIVFTSGGSESNTLAIWSAISSFPAKKHVISSRVEHQSVLQPLRFLQEKYGYELELLEVDGQGGLDLETLAAAIRSDTVLVSLMGANNETGVLWPVAEIGALCQKKAVLFHCDAVQMAGKIALDMDLMPVDYLSMAGHKLHGPKGAGALFAKRTAPLTPMIMGGGQEGGFRSGTENVQDIVGFGKACELAGQNLAEYQRQVAALCVRLEKGIVEAIPAVLVNGSGQPRLANTVNVSFKNCSSGALIQDLDEKGIAVSAHSACQSGDLNPSHVLAAMGVPESYLHGTIRLSLSRFNSEAEVEKFLDVLPAVVNKSRQDFAE